MSGAMVRADSVSLVHTSGIWWPTLCSTGTGKATAKTAAHIAVQSAFGTPDWSQPLQLPGGVPCVMPAMEATALTGPIIGMA